MRQVLFLCWTIAVNKTRSQPSRSLQSGQRRCTINRETQGLRSGGRNGHKAKESGTRDREKGMGHEGGSFREI